MGKQSWLSIGVAALSLGTLCAFQEPPQTSDMMLGHIPKNPKAQQIIEAKCVSCHSFKVINTALSTQKDMLRIQKQMERRGVQLTPREREVLGIYWKQNRLSEK